MQTDQLQLYFILSKTYNVQVSTKSKPIIIYSIIDNVKYLLMSINFSNGKKHKNMYL